MVNKSALTMLVSFYIAVVAGNPNGAPALKSVCENLIPDESSPHRFKSGSGGYSITTDLERGNSCVKQFFAYEENVKYTVTIKSSTNKAEGYLIQAWDTSGTRIGTFSPTQGNKILDCSSYISIPANATLTHSEINVNDSVVIYWIAPNGGSGMVDFSDYSYILLPLSPWVYRYTIVASNSEYYGPFSAASSAEGGLHKTSYILLLSVGAVFITMFMKL